MSEIDIRRGRQEAFAHQHPAALESLKQAALIQSVEASNAIENITAPHKRLEELVAQRTEPRNRSEAEIAGYRALEKLIETKETYYDALAASTEGWHDAEHDLRPWLSYFLGVITPLTASSSHVPTALPPPPRK